MYDYHNYNEQELVRRASKQDPKAFATLYEGIYQDLYRFALYTLKHKQDAEDVVSEVILSAYQNIGKLQKAEAFRGWIFRILTNACNKRFRNKDRTEQELQETDLVTNQDLSVSLDVRNAFEKLPKEDRLILAMSTFGGYTSTEISEILSVNANTVRSKRSRALEKMGQVLGLYGKE